MEPPSSGRIGVINNSGKRLPTALIEKAASVALSQRPDLQGPVSVLLATDEEIRDLNRKYRGVDEDTDVLTFPAIPLCAETQMAWPLGDIAISVPYAGRQAEKRGVSLDVELQFLTIHGVLHLLGWDDVEDADRQQMMAEMNRIGLLVGLPAEEEWSSVLHEEPA
ncbi:MAG TPA: rRNA maturation RNase YbeY [Fimbriimonadaceae bacterium]|jgi:rRNA maturation RNase YbeY